MVRHRADDLADETGSIGGGLEAYCGKAVRMSGDKNYVLLVGVSYLERGIPPKEKDCACI